MSLGPSREFLLESVESGGWRAGRAKSLDICRLGTTECTGEPFWNGENCDSGSFTAVTDNTK
jgi:hypothetical protein